MLVALVFATRRHGVVQRDRQVLDASCRGRCRMLVALVLATRRQAVVQRLAIERHLQLVLRELQRLFAAQSNHLQTRYLLAPRDHLTLWPRAPRLAPEFQLEVAVEVCAEVRDVVPLLRTMAP